MKIDDFGVEIWMNRYETTCQFNLAETCVESLTIAELLAITGKTDSILGELMQMKMTYGAIEGSDRLRECVASLYAKQNNSNVVVTHGAIGANALVYETLVEPGDRVVCVLPTYQQHYSIPQSFGADTHILKLREENGFLPDLAELERLVARGTKLIAFTNPNNPTGALMDRAFLEKVVAIARRAGAWILCDEVYRGIDQDGDGFTASIADLYDKGISTGSMSKAYSLAGLRLGWIVAPSDFIHAVSTHRDYSTISVGMIDDHLAAIALENRDTILARSRRIVTENLATLDAWVNAEPHMSYVKPKSGTTALLKYDFDIPSEKFCTDLLGQTGVMLVPGAAFGMEGYVRVGYANGSEILKEGLRRLSVFLHLLGPE